MLVINNLKEKYFLVIVIRMKYLKRIILVIKIILFFKLFFRMLVCDFCV